MELAFALGEALSVLQVIVHDNEDVEWFRQHGVSRLDLDLLMGGVKDVSKAFHSEATQRHTGNLPPIKA